MFKNYTPTHLDTNGILHSHLSLVYIDNGFIGLKLETPAVG